jgi:hypothetical protein
MAKNIITTVELVDDLDGSEASETIQFGWEGAVFQIDLSTKNAEVFRGLMAPYVQVARPAQPARRKLATKKPVAVKPSGSGLDGTQLSAVRVWARKQGITVSDKGRIAKTIVEQFEAAHAPKEKV